MKITIMEGGIGAAARGVTNIMTSLVRTSAMSREDEKWLVASAQRYIGELSSLRQRAYSGEKYREYTQTERVLTSFNGRLWAMLRVSKKTGHPALPIPLTRKSLERLANSFALDEPLPGSAKLVLITQGDKTARTALSFDWPVVAAQLLISDVLDAKGIGNAYDANAKGRGRDQACREIREAIYAGYRSWIIFDLKNHFSSVGPKHLKWLNLPPKVIRHSVFPNAEMHIQCPIQMNGHLKAARHGLPLGAMLSGKIASGLVGRELRTITGDCRVWSYVDDVAIGARSPAAANSIADAIKSKFENNPAGPLTFKHFDAFEAISGFSFLNYRFRLEWREQKEHVHIHPDRAAFKIMEQKLRLKLNDLNSTSFDAKVVVAHAYAEHWRASHPLWEPNQHALENLAGSVEVIASDHGTICAKQHHPILAQVG